MSSSEGSHKLMNSYEKVLARLCLEHGWASRSQIADAVWARSQDPAGGGSLSAVLVARGILTQEQASILQSESSDVTRSGAYPEVRKDDTWIGQMLLESGAATVEAIQEALALQEECASRKAPVPRLGEILIEKGVLTYSALQEVLQRQSRLVRLACPTCGARYAAEDPVPGKVYLCEQCASPLSSATRLPAVEIAEPEEVTRAAAQPKNVLDKYVLVSPLGKGSMGAVYKAWDRGLRRWVAIKLLIATSDPKLVFRFRREAETAAALQNPNIVPIYDVGESAGRPYLVMRFVEGSTLSGMSLSFEQACAITLQAAKGVGFAHERDVIHRDLKPGNIMVDGSGHVYVMDFGLAKDLYGAGGLTAPGTLMGTPSYMSPEQAAGKNQEVDRASDVYALGAIFYELVTGRPPFKSPRLMDTVRQVLEDPVIPPSKIRPDLNPKMEEVILRALEKDKTRRYPTASVFARALEGILAAPAAAASLPVGAPGPVSAPPPPPLRSASKVIFWAVVLLVLSVLAGLGVLHLLRGSKVG